MIGKIFSLILSLPELFRFIKGLLDKYKKYKERKRLEKLEEAFNKAEKSKTNQERRDASKDIHDALDS